MPFPDSPPRVPDGTRIYAVGDIHGRADLLGAILAEIERDLTRNPCDDVVEIFLGDYIDRGGHSRAVIDMLREDPSHDGERICLKGNHEDMLLEFLEDPEVLILWMQNGGQPTLSSYGITPPAEVSAKTVNQVRDQLSEALGPQRAFLSGLATSHVEGDYLFVHAGIRPGVSLEAQEPEDLMWIREPFLSFDGPLPHCVVHGHTPVEQPEIRPFRIDIDTGAVMSGVLTCLVLEEETRRFLSTG
ncbi:metallophosphoesterase family protein [Amorphus orientalis]|uniref:Serine/threonine protein phosphatase 1 n=1 Tax=Amorphus orientalis TaxID=649198 RepID=A0AAE3VNA5_9HYPH|nr:metallophosphoesterase family protein [Amorphus orientalis]MDQ0315197.1 serine/threonine protein phosphatase 1 [Amorphus orientalis]